MQETAVKRRLQNLCAGNCKKEEVSRDRNCVQETAEKKRLQELCSGNCKTEEGIGNVCRDQEERGIKSFLGKRRAKDRRVNRKKQLAGSGSVGSINVWVSYIRIVPLPSTEEIDV